jgi:hypothetical protein
MDTKDQEDLLQASKKALKMISVAALDTEFVFHLRDIIRRIEAQKCQSNTSEDFTSQA